MLAVDPELIVPDDEATKMIEAEQQAQAQQQNTERAALAARSAKDLSQSPVATDNLLTQLSGGRI
jgi:hypothetical protein